jgi:DNA end-binding protein Ku
MAAKATTAVPLRGTKLTLSFGLVNVPVAMKPLAETTRSIAGKLMCPEHGPTLNMQSVCSKGTPHEHVIENDERLKGYPHPDDPTQFVVVDPEIVKELEEPRTGDAAIEKIVDVEQIDPGYLDKTYLVWPQAGGEQGFDLLAAVLRKNGRAAVVTAVLSKQTSTILFRWSEHFGCLLAHTIRFDSRIRHADVQVAAEYAEKRPEPSAAHVDAAEALLATLEGELDTSEVVDRITPLMHEAIRAAANGETYKAPETTPEPTPEVDLLAALQASVAATKKTAAKKPAAKKRAKAAA